MNRLVFVAALAFASASLASDDHPGQWVKAGDPAQVNVGCTQVWHCVPIGDQLHSADTHIVATDNELTIGACSVGGGDIEGCNVCLAATPTTACTWHLEPN